MNVLQPTISKLELGRPVTFRNLTMFPLVGPSIADPVYRTLDEALDAGVARVTEVGEAGVVPRLRLLNDGDHPVLLLDGEEGVERRPVSLGPGDPVRVIVEEGLDGGERLLVGDEPEAPELGTTARSFLPPAQSGA